MILLHGKGTDLKDLKAVQRRAKCKLITQKVMLSLIDIAKEKGATDRVKAYWNTYHCQNLIYTANSRMYAPHCKNRFCTYCCGIRKAEMVHKYLPVLQCWKDPHFLTLTVKAVPAYRLQATLQQMHNTFSLINAKYRKRDQRGTGEKLMGLKTVESNFNPKVKTYNPHFHLIVPSRQIAETLVEEWLNAWGRKHTNRNAQHYRKVADREKDLIEVIKYEAKIFTEPDAKNTRGQKGNAKIYARALDNIYACMKGIRLIDRFGFNLPTTTKKKRESQLIEDYQLWQYNLQSRDWLTEDHESTLTAYTPPFTLEDTLETKIDTEIA